MSGHYWGAKPIEVKHTNALTLSADNHAVYGDTAAVLTRPANRRFLAFQILADGFWIKPGYHPGASFIDTLYDADADEITVTAHGFTSGDGPYQMTAAAPAIVGTPGIVLSTTPDILTRDAGSWLTEGFEVNQKVTLAESASNNGVLTVTGVTELVLTVAETITPEGSQTDLTLTATVELPPGLDLLTNYWVEVIDDDTIQLHTTHAGAVSPAGTPVDLSRTLLTPSTAVVIDDGPPGTFTRVAGSWIDDGFRVGYPFIVSGSASNNSAFIPTVVTDLVLTVADTLTIEGSQTDLVMTAQYPGGVHTVGAMTAAVPSATNTAGQEALKLAVGADVMATRPEVIAAPERLTVLGDAATASMVYWWLP